MSDAPAVTTATPISKMPYSCGDLQQMGHASSGLYSILGAKQIETVYCDFTQPINAQGIMMLQNNKSSRSTDHKVLLGEKDSKLELDSSTLNQCQPTSTCRNTLDSRPWMSRFRSRLKWPIPEELWI